MVGRKSGHQKTSLSQEQLQALGVTSKELQNATSTPPAIFPTLASKPVPLETSSSRDYKILWKEDFISYLRDSPYHLHKNNQDNKIQRYSDKYIKVLTKSSDQNLGEFHWSMMPSELRPTFKRKKTTDVRIGKIRIVNIDEKLKQLEQEEVKGDPKKDKNSDEENEEDEEVQEDEEMDEDNDYGNSYFDNGDAYNDEDDNLDDGPVY